MDFDGFLGGTYTGLSPAIDGERAINTFPRLIESGHGKSQYCMIGVDGKRLHCTLPTTPLRCLFGGDNRLFAVAGSRFYEVFGDGTYTDLGDVGTATTPATIISNGNELFIVSGAQGYLANGITVSPVVAAVAGAFLDGYFVAVVPDSNQFRVSALLDGSVWDGTMIASKEGQPDRLTMILADHEELWLFGEKTTEVWYDAGNTSLTGAVGFPFQRIQGAFIEQGIRAPFSAVKLDNTVFWLGGDDRGVNIVWRAQGFLPTRVSTHAIEDAMRGYSNTFDAVAYSYQANGHAFYVISFPSAQATWVYDCSTQMWHERGYWDTSVGQYKADIAQYHAYTLEQHFLGDPNNGNIYILDENTYTDNGNVIRRLRSSPHISKEQQRMRYSYFTVDVQVFKPFNYAGIPQLAMQYSDDGGFTWSNERLCGGAPLVSGQQHSLSQGGVGQYKFRYTWRRCGASRDRCFRVVCTEPIQWVLTDAYIGLEPGTGPP